MRGVEDADGKQLMRLKLRNGHSSFHRAILPLFPSDPGESQIDETTILTVKRRENRLGSLGASLCETQMREETKREHQPDKKKYF